MNVEEPDSRARGAALLLAHCEAMSRLVDEPRPAPFGRVAAELGPELARHLVDALAGTKPMRTAPSWVPRRAVA
jgi:hypothetical protein